MNAEVHQDPFAAPPDPFLPQQELEVEWFDAPRRSSRPTSMSSSPSRPPASPIDDPVADPWFR